MSTDDRQNGQPDVPAENNGSGGQQAHPPLPDLPPWESPSAADADGPAALEPEASPSGIGATGAPVTESATRQPLGGPYVVTDAAAPVAEQATAAYDTPLHNGPAVTSSEPVAPAYADPTPAPVPYPAAAFAPAPAPVATAQYAYAQASSPQPVYVAPAPMPPRPRGNRGGGSLIALVGTIAYAVVYAAVAFVIFALSGSGGTVDRFLSFLVSAAFLIPVAVFAIALILLVLIVNRAGWWAYVLGGFLVAVVVYFGAIAGALVTVQAWNFTAQEMQDFVREVSLDPLTLAAAIVAREASVWAGAWVSRRGRAIKARNIEERERFEAAQADARTAAAAYGEPPAHATTW
jgi:hypothetical protein